MTASISAQDQIASFIAEGNSERVLAFKFAPSIQKQIEILVQKKKDGIITLEQKEDLERFLSYDLLIGLAKARAFQMVNTQ